MLKKITEAVEKFNGKPKFLYISEKFFESLDEATIMGILTLYSSDDYNLSLEIVEGQEEDFKLE